VIKPDQKIGGPAGCSYLGKHQAAKQKNKAKIKKSLSQFIPIDSGNSKATFHEFIKKKIVR